MPRRKTREEHIADLAIHGRVELVGEWKGANYRTQYRCLEHGEIHAALAASCVQGKGLACCRAANAKRAGRALGAARNAEAAKSYDAAIEGRLQRLAPYVDCDTPILHRCLLHGEEHEARPTNLRSGQGLICCKQAAIQTNATFQKGKSASRYEGAIAGRLELLEEYKGAHIPVLHRCLIHGEKHLQAPTRGSRGGLVCCRQAGTDTLTQAVTGTARFTKQEVTSLYVFELLNHPGFVKLGIAQDVDDRADEEYCAMAAEWVRPNRVEAFLLELAAKQATQLMAKCPAALAGWVGYTEVRQMPSGALVALMQELVDAMDAAESPWHFALANIRLTKAERKLVEERASALAQVA